ncbi:MAG: winged helix-turn-helix domain-containing protein [Leifsonia sp.]
MDRPEKRLVDVTALKALAHPLRVALLDALSQYGEATASGLAERLGESSGATSYHLRQLAKHDFVQEVPDRGTGRERWWKRSPGGFVVGVEDQPDAASKEAARLVINQWHSGREQLLTDFMDRGDDELAPEWTRAAVLSTFNMRLTAEQLAEIVGEFERIADDYIVRFRDQNPPGSRPVQFQFNAFPIMDGEETPS